MAKPVSVKPEEQLARSYVDRLILVKLTEMESAVKLSELADKMSSEGIGLSTIRALLASNADRFAYHERRWVPASRLLSEGRSCHEAVVLFLERVGAPVKFDLLLAEVALSRGEAPSSVEPVLARLIERDPAFLTVGRDEVALAGWGFEAVDQPLPRALALNGLDPEDLEKAKAALGRVDLLTQEGHAEALAKLAPISLKLLGALLYEQVAPWVPTQVALFQSRTATAMALGVPGFVLSPMGTLHAETDSKRWVATASKLAERLVSTIEVDDAAPLEIQPEDAEKLVRKIVDSDHTVTATGLLEEFFESTIGGKTFKEDLAATIAILKVVPSVQWVGGDRFRKRGDVPDFIHEIPEPFHFVDSDVLNEEGEPVDVELTDEGLSSSLRKLLQHPLATDVLDEEPQPAPKTMPETVRLVLKSIHRELGTFPLSQIPTDWISHEPEIQEVIFRDALGRDLQVWLNQSARLAYNLGDWWFDQSIESGAVFTLTKASRPNVFEFAWMDQPDPVVYISSQRMEELRRIGSDGHEKSTLDLLIEVMTHWPKGADYLTILAELNVVRRCSRRLVASLLSSYQCFYQRSGSPVWHFDPKKIELGFDKTKRKFVKR